MFLLLHCCVQPTFHTATLLFTLLNAGADILNHSLHSNAGLTYADGTPAHMAATTKVAIQEARKMVATMGALYQVRLQPFCDLQTVCAAGCLQSFIMCQYRPSSSQSGQDGMSWSDSVTVARGRTQRGGTVAGQCEAVWVRMQVANRGLGVLTYVSQSRPGGGSSDDDEARRPGPAAEASSYQEWTSQEFSHPVQEEASTWPPVDPQGKGPISERGPEESSGGSSADMPNSEGGDSGGGPSSAAPPR